MVYAFGLYRFLSLIMKQSIKSNSLKDIQKVVPGCCPDLNMALSSGVIPSTGTESQYNGLEDLSDIGHRVREPFDVIHFDREYQRIGRQIEDKRSKRSK